MCTAIKLSTAMVVTDRTLDFKMSIVSAMPQMPTTRTTEYMDSKVYLYSFGRPVVLEALALVEFIALSKMEKINELEYVCENGSFYFIFFYNLPI